MDPMTSGEEELFEFCESESLSEEGLREIIERHRWSPTISMNASNHGFFFVACENGRVTEGIIRYLLDIFPRAARAVATKSGCTPLHSACFNKNVTPNITQLLVDAAPNSVRNEDNDGNTPLHILCFFGKRRVDIKILKLLIEKFPEAVRHEDDDGNLPIHIAAGRKSPEFCQMLIEAYPGSEQIRGDEGLLPLHHACERNSLTTVEYLYQQYPNAIDHATTMELYPIHFVINSMRYRSEPAAAVEIIRFLLDCDSNQNLKQFQGQSLLRYACGQEYDDPPYNDSKIEAGIQIIKIIYDSHPEAIEDNTLLEDIESFCQQVRAFIMGELVYARHARDLRHMNTPDANGQLPLHKALQNNVRLGSIKLLVKGNPSAIRSIDDSGTLPLHLACEHHGSASVVEYILSLARITHDTTDRRGNTALHCACRGAKYETIALLLEKYDAASVSKTNGDDKLPIDLLWESNAVEDRESVEYMGSVFRLLRAYPETVAISNSV